DHGAAVVTAHEDVRRLHVAVDDAGIVGCVQRPRRALDQIEQTGDRLRERSAVAVGAEGPDLLLEGLALDEFHDHERHLAVLADPEHPADPAVRDAPGRGALAPDALEAARADVPWMGALDRELTGSAPLARPEDDRVGTTAEFLEDLVLADRLAAFAAHGAEPGQRLFLVRLRPLRQPELRGVDALGVHLLERVEDQGLEVLGLHLGRHRLCAARRAISRRLTFCCARETRHAAACFGTPRRGSSSSRRSPSRRPSWNSSGSGGEGWDMASSRIPM